MRTFIIKTIINAISLLIIVQLIKGIYAESYLAIIFAAIILGALNAVIKPLLIIMTLPINFMSLGLFTLVINGLILEMVDWIVPGFSVSGFFTTIFAAFLLSIISMLLSAIIGNNNYNEKSNHKKSNKSYIDI